MAKSFKTLRDKMSSESQNRIKIKKELMLKRQNEDLSCDRSFDKFLIRIIIILLLSFAFIGGMIKVIEYILNLM